MSPFFHAGVAESGLIDYFNRLSAEVETALILYNFPRHTQNPITARVLDAVNHYGIKDNTRDFSLATHTPHYFVGGDKHITAAYKAGGFGFVSAQASHVPHPYVALEEALAAADVSSATYEIGRAHV